MLRKMLDKLKRDDSKRHAPKTDSTSISPKLLTATGWKRLMMKKYRKPS